MTVELSTKFIEEIKRFDIIYCLISGGYHSTTAALLLWYYGFTNVKLVHNKTFLELKSSLDTMKKLLAITKFEYLETTPNLKKENVWDILRRSFLRIPEVREDIKNKKYDRSKFECCNKLKKFPAKKFYRKIRKVPDGEEIKSFIIISSICPYESRFRNMHLHELRQKDTFLRLHKKAGDIWFGYPFRDARSVKPFREYLFSKDFKEIKHSGCTACPIIIAFRMYDTAQYYLSSKAAVRAGLPCFQKTMEDFIDGN
ncbi:hypothetical protein LCGC14_0372040 [marine sediment metagenome]|uniref:Phosphoadenosine phosphosulphate reductase domain-containing protein n=1 Tax=marine sediment metagenome TaxID=412755 RepID=A0A0F9TN49_9ZZZZ